MISIWHKADEALELSHRTDRGDYKTVLYSVYVHIVSLAHGKPLWQFMDREELDRSAFRENWSKARTHLSHLDFRASCFFKLLVNIFFWLTAG